MIETLLGFIEIVRPFIGWIFVLGFCGYIVYQSKIITSAVKIAKESPSPEIFWEAYMGLMKGILKTVGMFLVKYVIYLTLYGTILLSAYNLAGFELTVLFALILILARIQLKKWTINVLKRKENNDFEELKKKYNLQKKLLDEAINKKEKI